MTDASNISTASQLRARIDSGVTGEKVAAEDPAAAPLGTDDEAAGFPPTASEARLAAATAPQAPPERPDLGAPLYLVLITLIAILMVLLVMTALASG